MKNQAVLMREARHALSVKTNADVYPAIQPITEAARAFVGGGTVSHYRNNTWGVSWIGPGAQDCFISITARDLVLTPSEFVKRVLHPPIRPCVASDGSCWR